MKSGDGRKAEQQMSEEMKEKLENAGKKAEEQKEQRRERTVKGSHLQPALVKLAKETGLNYIEKSGFAQVHGKRKGLKVYLALKGGRVDFSGFAPTADAVTQISEEEAKTKHLGKVRGTIDFDKTDEQILEAFKAGLVELLVEPPPEVKKEAKPKAEKKPAEKTPAETTTTTPETTPVEGSTTEATPETPAATE